MFLLLNNNRSGNSSGQAFFHSCQPVGIDAFKVVRFSFPSYQRIPYTIYYDSPRRQQEVSYRPRESFCFNEKNEFAVIINNEGVGGTQPRLIFGGVDYQCVIKCCVETRPKKACVSTLYLKWCLIISELQNAPWPRPASANIGFLKETLPPPCQSSFATVAFV